MIVCIINYSEAAFEKIVAISLNLHLLHLDNVVITLHISKRYEEPFQGYHFMVNKRWDILYLN